MNSSIVFFTTIAFIAFGYASFIRILYKNSGLAEEQLPQTRLSSLLAGADASFIVVSLFSASLLLFWGWGPALLWIIVFHLIADTAINLSQSRQRSSYLSLESHFLSSHTNRSLAVNFLWQLFLCLIISLVASLLAQLFDTHSGLLFVVGGAYLAWYWLNNSQQQRFLVKLCFALIAIFLGFVLSTKLGWSLYGDWQLLPNLAPWISLNNQSIWVIILLFTAVKFALNEDFYGQLNRANGWLVLLLTFGLIVALLWQRPELDAPMLSNKLAENSNAPSLLFYGLFITASLVMVIFKLINLSKPNLEQSQVSRFYNFQSASLIQLFWQLALYLCLAAAIGIGAWQTHFFDWVNDHSINTQFELTTESLMTVWQVNSSLNNSDSLVSTVVLSIIAFLALNFITHCIKLLIHCAEFNQKQLHPNSQDALSAIQQTSLTANEVHPNNLSNTVMMRSHFAHYPTIFFISCYLLFAGASLPYWSMITAIAWCLVCDYLLTVTSDLDPSSRINNSLKIICLVFISIGGVCLLALSIVKAVDRHFLLAALPLSALLLSALLWHQPIKFMLSQLRSSDEKSLFND